MLILVYQLGKAGSTSIDAALRTRFPSNMLLRLHFMGPFVCDRFEQILRAAPATEVAPSFVENICGQVAIGRVARDTVAAAIAASTPIKVICGIREPIDYCASVFAQVAYDGSPIGGTELGTDPASIAAAHRRFCTLLEASLQPEPVALKPLDAFLATLFRLSRTWLHDDFAPCLGFLPRQFVYRAPFHVAKHGAVETLIYRFEDLGSDLESGLRHFVEWPEFSIPSLNVSHEKAYGAFYRQFRANLCLPRDLVAAFTASDIVAQFYAGQEAGLLERWAEPGSAARS